MRWAVAALAGMVLVLAVGWALFVPIADWLATHDVGPVRGSLRTARLQTARDAALGRLLTLGAGALAAGALLYTARNFTVSRRMFELAGQGQVADRYTRAIEQLGSEKLDVRIGGIYALERIARDSARDHPTVVEVLVAFIREHSGEQWAPGSNEATSEDSTTLALLERRGPRPLPAAGQHSARPDVQAALTVIGRRDSIRDREPIRLANANLSHAILTGARLAGADLAGAYLTRANLAGADLTGADLTRADLRFARLTGASLAEARLAWADLTGADLTPLDLSGTDVTRANPRPKLLTHADLARAGLTEMDLAESYLDDRYLTAKCLARADLTGADLGWSDLTEAWLIFADLTGAHLSGAILTGARHRGANFTDVVLDRTSSDPSRMQVPEGWVRDPRSGKLRLANEDASE